MAEWVCRNVSLEKISMTVQSLVSLVREPTWQEKSHVIMAGLDRIRLHLGELALLAERRFVCSTEDFVSFLGHSESGLAILGCVSDNQGS